MLPHSWTNFPNILNGPHFSTFLNLPKMLSSSYVIPISTSSDWIALSAPMGMSSADGMASRKLPLAPDHDELLPLTFPKLASRTLSEHNG